jgi:hypothetical protein
MTIQMHKFGTILNSRPAGREAFLAISPTLLPTTEGEHQLLLGIPDVREGESIELDVVGVEVLRRAALTLSTTACH